ncbi:MAG TPA: carboxypeptidase regulatory-like domain-containing protein [Gemmatimonadales bacterium]|nr:carboxypeptidase regulatory-like domain-containing protein [Gemmatimonadales bacterium]
MMRRAPLPFLIPLALAFAGRAWAQPDTATLAGRILDSDTRGPVVGASLDLLDLGRRGRTDDSGRFSFSSIPRGSYRVRALAIGYAATTWQLHAAPGPHGADTLWMTPRPVVLDTVHVKGAQDNDWRSPAALERRREHGGGYFLMREEIDARQANTLGELLQAIPGTATMCRMGECRTYITRSTAQGCQPLWYVDGFPATFAGGPEFPSRFIEAVEVYLNPGDAPMEMQQPGQRCGIIAIWTRRQP